MTEKKEPKSTDDDVEITPEMVADAELQFATLLIRRRKLFNSNGIWKIQASELVKPGLIATAVRALKNTGLATLSTTSKKLNPNSVVTLTLTKAGRDVLEGRGN